MNIFINGERFTINASENETPVINKALTQFLNADQQDRTYAVALNSEFVGRDEYATTLLNAGDSMDVLFPIQGG